MVPSLLDEILAADKLLQTVVIRVFLEVIAQVLPLLLKNVGHLLIHLLKQLVDLWQELARRGFESVAHLVQRILAEYLSALLIKQASLRQIALHALDRAREFREEFFPLFHLFLVSVSLREVTS